MEQIEKLMNALYDLLMDKRLEAFDDDRLFNYSQIENASGLHNGELLFEIVLGHFQENEEYEKCANIISLRNEFRVKFGSKAA